MNTYSSSTNNLNIQLPHSISTYIAGAKLFKVVNLPIKVIGHN